MADLGTVVANVVLGFWFRHHLEDFFGLIEVIFDEDLGVVVRALGALFAVAVGVVPAQFSDDVLELAEFAMEAKTHVKVGATFVDVAVRAMLSFLASLLHKIWANFEIMTEVALVPVPAGSHRLVLVAGLDLAFVVGVGAVVGEAALPVDELFADSVGRQFVVVGWGGWLIKGRHAEKLSVHAVGDRHRWILIRVHGYKYVDNSTGPTFQVNN